MPMFHTLSRQKYAVIAACIALAFTLAVVIGFGSLTPKPLVQTASAAQSDYYLKIDDIKGESSDAGHQGEIEVNSWSWGASNPTTVGSGTGGLSGGKVNFQDLSVMKRIDKATPKLFLICASGEHIKQATLTAPGPRGEDRLRYTFFDVFCTSVTHTGSGSDMPTESLSLNYAKIIVEYKAKGSATWESVGWDIAKNVKI